MFAVVWEYSSLWVFGCVDAWGSKRYLSTLASTLGWFHSLKEIVMQNCCTNKGKKIEERPDWCVFSGLRRLHGIPYDGSTSDGSSTHKADEIIDALVGHSDLRWIHLEGVAEGLLIGRTGCVALVTILCNTAHIIVSLHLKNTQLTREGPATLARGLASNSTLNELSISNTNVEEDRTPFTEPGWHTIFSAFCSPMCRLEKLQLRCSNLKTLDISHTLQLTISGCREILQPLQTPCFRLECLILN